MAPIECWFTAAELLTTLLSRCDREEQKSKLVGGTEGPGGDPGGRGGLFNPPRPLGPGGGLFTKAQTVSQVQQTTKI